MLAPGGIGALAAVGAGLASFCSPCVLPLVPGYLAYLTGTAGADAAVLRARRWRIAGHALAFVVGFGPSSWCSGRGPQPLARRCCTTAPRYAGSPGAP